MEGGGPDHRPHIEEAHFGGTEGYAVRLDFPGETSELVGDTGIVDSASLGTEHVYTRSAVSKIISIHHEPLSLQPKNITESASKIGKQKG